MLNSLGIEYSTWIGSGSDLCLGDCGGAPNRLVSPKWMTSFGGSNLLLEEVLYHFRQVFRKTVRLLYRFRSPNSLSQEQVENVLWKIFESHSMFCTTVVLQRVLVLPPESEEWMEGGVTLGHEFDAKTTTSPAPTAPSSPMPRGSQSHGVPSRGQVCPAWLRWRRCFQRLLRHSVHCEGSVLTEVAGPAGSNLLLLIIGCTQPTQRMFTAAAQHEPLPLKYHGIVWRSVPPRSNGPKQQTNIRC